MSDGEREEAVAPPADNGAPSAADKTMYREQLRGALLFRKKFKREERWRSYLQILGHNFYASETLQADSPTVNIMAARVRAQPPKLAFGIPSFKVTPWTGAPTPNSAVAWEAWGAMTWETEGFDVSTQRVTLDWPTFGIGIGFVGFEQAANGEVIDSKRRLFGILPPAATARIAEATGGLSDVFATEQNERMSILMRQRVFLERVGCLNFVIDPCADSWDDAQFMARRISLPRAVALSMLGRDCPSADSIRNVALYTDGDADDPFSERPSPDLVDKLPDAVKRVDLWELWNIVTRKTIYADSQGKVLRVYGWRSPHPGFPFVPMLWDEIPDVVWPEGLAAAAKPLNDELHLLRRRELQEAKKAIGRIRIDPNLSRDAKAAIRSGKDGGVFEAEEGQVEAINLTSIDSNFWLLENRIKADIDEVTQTSPYEAQAVPTVKRSATEASIIQSTSDAISSWRKNTVEQFAAQVLERAMAIAMTTFDEPIPLSIINQDPAFGAVGQSIEFPFIPTEHVGHFRVQTVEDTMMSQAKDIERQQLALGIQLFSAFPWFKAREAAAHYMSMLASVRDPYKFILTETEAAEQQAQQAQQAQQGAAPPGTPPSGPPSGPPEGLPGGTSMPMFPGMEGENGGSGNMTADMLAALAGAQAPGAGGGLTPV
jgi:hypothetical protein